MTRTNVRRTVTTGAVVTTAVAATVAVGLEASASQTTGQARRPGSSLPGAPGPRARYRAENQELFGLRQAEQ